MSSPKTPKRYRHFEQSEGELCTLPATYNDITHNAVGTFRCRTCLCLYARFKDQSIFVAHMSAQNALPISPSGLAPSDPSKPSKKTTSSAAAPQSSKNENGGVALKSSDILSPAQIESNREEKLKWTSLPESGNRLKDFVLKQLQSESWADNRDQVVEAFVVSGSMHNEEAQGEKFNALWICDAIKEFFAPFVVQTYRAHGFVAGPEVPKELFKWSGQDEQIREETERIPESYGWTSCDQELMPLERFSEMDWGEWAFCSKDGVWNTARAMFPRPRGVSGASVSKLAEAISSLKIV